MSDLPIRFPTVAANWAHFSAVDIAPDAPQIQRDEMQRAFMAGLSSGLLLTILAHQSTDPRGEVEKIKAELEAWSALRKAMVRA